MKSSKKYLFCVAMYLCCTIISCAYVSLVREGVQWVYHESFRFVMPDDHSKQCYRFLAVEFRGDTVIDGYIYSKCFRYEMGGMPRTVFEYDGEDWAEGYDELWVSGTQPAACVRDEAGRVYCIHRNSSHPDLIYNFCDLFIDGYYRYQLVDSVGIQNQICRRYAVGYDYGVEDSEIEHLSFEQARIVEGVGVDATEAGDLLLPYFEWPICWCSISSRTLVCVRNKADGRIIYKGLGFERWPFERNAADVNDDGLVDVGDLGIVVNGVLGHESIYSDVNNDGTVDVSDVNAVVNAILK